MKRCHIIQCAQWTKLTFLQTNWKKSIPHFIFNYFKISCTWRRHSGVSLWCNASSVEQSTKCRNTTQCEDLQLKLEIRWRDWNKLHIFTLTPISLHYHNICFGHFVFFVVPLILDSVFTLGKSDSCPLRRSFMASNFIFISYCSHSLQSFCVCCR